MLISGLGWRASSVAKPCPEERLKFLQTQVRRWLEQRDPAAWTKINQERSYYELYGQGEAALSELLSLADLAEITSQPFPYELFLKLGAKVELAPGEEVGLRNWLDAIQRPGFTPSIHSVNKALAGLQVLIKPPFEAQELTWQLYKRAPRLFEQKDPLYLEAIKKQYGPLTAFGVEGLYLNREGKLFGQHASDLGLRKRSAEGAWGVPFFLQEGCVNAPLPERWLRDHPVCKEVKDPLFEPFLSLLTKFVKEGAAPQGFTLDEIYLSGGKLYTLKPFSKGFLDLVEWEERVVRISDGCKEVYQELMQKSGLANHPGFLFWKEAMDAAAKNQEFDIPFEAAKRAIGDGRIVHKARLLASQVQRGLQPLQMI
jgi:hypothetical protein